MKKIIALCLLLTSLVQAQNIETKVWELLLNNKRTEARILFDKSLKKEMYSNIDYLILDAFINNELGQTEFDEQFISKFVDFPEAKEYLYSIWYLPFALNHVNANGYNDKTYQKMDILAQTPLLQDIDFVNYNKAVVDRRRYNIEGYNSYISKLQALNNWQFCGVFENLNDSGIDTEYDPETYAKNDKSFDANSNGFVGWYNPKIKQNEGYHFFSNENEYGNGIIYAQTFIDNPETRSVVMQFGVSKSVKIFLNDVEIFYNNESLNNDLNGFRLQFMLPKGTNRLLIKSSVGGGSDYFFVNLKDLEGKPMQNLTFYDTYKTYNTSSIETLQVKDLPTADEAYMLAKIASNPTHPMYQLLMFHTLMNNNKHELAHDYIEGLIEKYPNSSMLKTRMMLYHYANNEGQLAEELAKNLEVSDEDYYFNIITKFEDGDFTRNANINELEKQRSKAKKMRSQYIVKMYDYLIAARNSDIDYMIDKIEEVIAEAYNNELYIVNFATLYDALKKDKSKTIKILEDFVARVENHDAINKLIGYYRSQDNKEKVKSLILQKIDAYPYFNTMRYDYIDLLNADNNHDEALAQINIGLDNFPYSFRFMESKGVVYNFKKNPQEAEKFYRQSLTHHSGNTSLRKKLYDLIKLEDELEQVTTKDIYKLVKSRRNSKMKNDYGVVVLLDEYLVNILPEGGRKSKVVYVYEVMNENGVEELKEYNLGYGYNINKSEIIKPDGSIVPAERGGGSLVFTNLKVGDVVYIDYDKMDNATGRFYKDFNLSYAFNGYFPSEESIFGVIHPEDITYKVDYTNGIVTPKTSKLNQKTYTVWHKKNISAIPIYENYSPQFSDLTNVVRLSSIKSWKEISNWYADLVKKNLKLDKVTIGVFNEIFPNGTHQLTETEIAKKIYSYIGQNITYSSLDFRQSGYVPQKPAKTITTKLGDCKDVSTLFVALATQAGLKSNLVLVLTNDYGFKTVKMPAIEFNHCIVKVTIDGKDHFLELTDKYLPFMAMPMSLYQASALVISFDKAENEKSVLINIPFTNALQNISKVTTTIQVDDTSKYFVNRHTIHGAGKSYYNELFSNAISDDMRKKEFEEDYNAKLKKIVNFDGFSLIQNETFDSGITFETKFSISERLQSLGNLKVLDIPFIDKTYTRSVISQDKRNFDINYISYENTNKYDTEVILNLSPDKKFIEVPESKKFSWREHSYELNYDLISPNSLKVTRIVSIPWENISTQDYTEYKKFVEDIIEAEEQIVGFK
jgi:hypothetical protein